MALLARIALGATLALLASRPPVHPRVLEPDSRTLSQLHRILGEARSRRWTPSEEWLRPEGDGAKYGRLLFVSDLHMGAGVDPHTGARSALEDFLPGLQEREFRRMLEHVWRAAEDDPEMRTLVINGDGFELDLTDTGPYPIRPDGSLGSERILLETDAHGVPIYNARNARLKLEAIREGHPDFFRGLGEHVRRGFRLRIGAGNHDRLIAHPVVWAFFREIVATEVEDLLRAEHRPARAAILEARRLVDDLVELDHPLNQLGDVAWGHGHWNDTLAVETYPHAIAFGDASSLDELPVDFGYHVVNDLYRPLRRTKSEPRQPSLAATSKVLEAWRALGTVPLLRAAAGVISKDGHPPAAEVARLEALERQRVLKMVPLRLSRQLREVERTPLSDVEVAERVLAFRAALARPLLDLFPEGSGLLERAVMALRNPRAIFEALPARSLDYRTKRQAAAASQLLGAGIVLRGHEHREGISREFLVGDLTKAPRAVRVIDSASWLGPQRGVVEVRFDKGGSHAELMRWDDIDAKLVVAPLKQ